MVANTQLEPLSFGLRVQNAMLSTHGSTLLNCKQTNLCSVVQEVGIDKDNNNRTNKLI